MTETLLRLDEAGDAELISAVRGGDVSAYGPLFERHVGAARRLARQLVGAADADDLVSDAFAKVLRVLQGGGGPDIAFRAYLLTAVRRLHVDKIRANSKLHTTDNLEPFDPGVPFRDTAVEGFESAAAAQAFATLPERWQAVLWHTEVEGQKPAEVAVLLGMTPNSVSALAYRAREGLRQAFLNSHISELDDDHCTWTHEHLGAYIRSGVSKRDATKVEKHLDDCRKCMAIYLELTEINGGLAGILAPLLLGSAGAGYLASSSLAAKGGILLFLDRAKDTVAANSQAATVAGVAAASVVVAGSVLALTGGDEPRPAGDPPGNAAPVSTESPGDLPTSGPKPGTSPRPGEPGSTAPPAVVPLPGRSSVADPTTAPTDAPTSSVPTTDPTSGLPTSEQPTSEQPTSEQPTSEQPTSEQPTSEQPTSEQPTSETPTTGPPTTTPPRPPDLTLSVTRDQNGSSTISTLTVRVTGLEAGGGATLRMSVTGRLTVGLNLDDPRCSVISLNGATCRVTTTPATYVFKVREQNSPVTFTLTPDAGTGDADPGNNTRSVVLD